MMLNDKIFDKRVPKTNEKYFAGLTVEEKETYYIFYEGYLKLFSNYLITKIGILDAENCIKSLNYKEISVDNMDMYQYLCKDIFKYFYIRNNLYIERLNNNEKIYLKTIIDSNNYDMNADKENFIKNTFQNVIKVPTTKDKIVKVAYGPNVEKYFKDNDAIILGFRINEILNDNEEIKLNLFLNVLEQEFSKNDLKVNIIKYYTSSINIISL